MQMPRTRNLLVMMLIALTVTAICAGDAWACPNCKEGMAGNDPVSVARATGYYYSILFMMAMPFVIVGTFGGAAYLSIRRAREQQAKNNSPSTEPPATA